MSKYLKVGSKISNGETVYTKSEGKYFAWWKQSNENSMQVRLTDSMVLNGYLTYKLL